MDNAVGPTRPLLLFDGECGFCRRWISRWQSQTGEAIEYAPFQEAGWRFPHIPRENFAREVHFIETDGTVTAGAHAVYRALAVGAGSRWPLWCYRHLPGVRWTSEQCYRFVANHRFGLSRVTRRLWGNEPGPLGYVLTRWVFLRLLGVIYFVAFVSLGVQILGLVGSQGILPAGDFLQSVHQRFGEDGYWRWPTLAWINSSDRSLQWMCWGGAGLSTLLILNIAPALVLLLLWVLYLSLYHIGQVFLGFQWDLLLLETGFLAILFAPWRLWPRLATEPAPSYLVLLLQRWLIFRLMFMSGVVKLTEDHPVNQAWHKLTALTIHYQTQPLPNALAWYVHQLPVWFHQFSCLMMFGIEIGVPFFFFLPRRIRLLGFFLQLLFQLLIAATGNYNFFNLLAVALCIPLLDDRFLCSTLLGGRLRPPVIGQRRRRGWLHRMAIAPATVAILLVSTIWTVEVFREFRQLPDWCQSVLHHSMRFGSVNAYGLFRHMTMDRPEIIVEGSQDGRTWQTYEFRWKPGDTGVRPKQVAPHQPRLDWQMWFAALGDYRSPNNGWFLKFLRCLLEGKPEVLGLLRANPFPDAPPKYVRAVLYDYQFTDRETRMKDGAWWTRKELRPYTPVLSLESFQRR